VKQVDKDYLPLTSKNLGKVLNNMLIDTGVFLNANFGSKGPIPGYPRVYGRELERREEPAVGAL
jgi:hypothetical protein